MKRGYMVRSKLFALAILMIWGGVWSGCVTPVIPLPPPDPSIMSLSVDETEGEVVISGVSTSSAANALFSFLNVRTGKGIIARAEADGSFVTAPLKALDGDPLDMWVSRVIEDQPSGGVRVLIRYSGELQYSD